MNINKEIAKVAGISLVAFVLTLSSCKNDPLSPGVEYMPDMYRSPSYETYSSNPNFSDSLTARKPVAGTITRGHSVTGEFYHVINATPYPYPNTPEGYEAAGAEYKNPLQATPENIEAGKQIYGKFCVNCHGDQGKGDGSIVANGKFPGPPPSYSGPLKDLPEGKMFHSITYGKGLMGSHASQLTKEERWKLVLYVQTLQRLGQPAKDTTVVGAPGQPVNLNANPSDKAGKDNSKGKK